MIKNGYELSSGEDIIAVQKTTRERMSLFITKMDNMLL